MRKLGNRAVAAAWIALFAAAQASAESVDFESASYAADKTFIGADQWAQIADPLGTREDNFKVQAGAGGKWAHVQTTGTATAYRPFNANNGILDVRWKWRALGDSAHFCLGVASAAGSARTGNRALACLEAFGPISAQGLGIGATATGETWKAGIWYYMRMVLDNSPNANKFSLYVSEDSLRGTERLALPATAMGGSGAFARLALRGENGNGYVDVDDITWEAVAVWQGGGAQDSAWTMGRNWSTNQPPDSLTHAVFPAGSAGCLLDKNAAVKSVTVAPGFKGALNLGQQTLTVGGNADFTGARFRSSGGQIRFASSRGQSLKGPDSGRYLAPLRHDGAGLLRLDGRGLFAEGVAQIQGAFDFNGFDLIVNGDWTVKNGRPGTLRNLDGRSITVVRATRLEGAAKDTLLGLNPSPKGWTLAGSAADSVQARFAALGNSHVTMATGYAFQSADAGGNTGWIFPNQPLPRLNEPAIAPEPLTFDDSVSVTMAPPIDGADVFYTVDETDPDSTKLRYSKPFTLKSTTTVSAIAYKAGWLPSPVHTRIYIRRAADTLPGPGAAPPGGSFADSIVVRLSPPAEAPQASIYYMLGGAGPYRFQDSLVLRETTVLKAIAISGSRYSDTAEWTFSKRIEPPRAAPAGRAFADTLRVLFTSRIEGASVFYTADGSDPTPASKPFPGQGLLLDSTAVIKAIAVKGSDVSAAVAETYTLIPDPPAASPRGGDYSSPITVQLTAKAARADIYYTLDGSTPGPERGLPPYSGPFNLDTSATLKAVAVAGKGAGLQRSALLIETYTFIRPGPRVLGPGQRIDLSSNYNLVSPLPGAAPVDVEVIAVDSLGSMKGFRDMLFGIKLSVAEGATAFPTVVLNAPAGEARSLYAVNPGGTARWLARVNASEIHEPGTYFMAVDTLPPLVTFSGETFTSEDSTRLVVSIQDNVSNLLLDMERSDNAAAGFKGREINGTMLLTVSLKNPKGTLQPLTLRLKVDDHSRPSWFPANGAPYPLAQRTVDPVRSPAAFHIGSNAADPWDLIAIPLAVEPPLTLARLRKNNGVPDLDGVTLVPGTGKYRFLAADEPLPPGAAVWIASAASLPSMAFPALQTVSHKGSGSYRLTLHEGWNLVASPILGALYWPVTRNLPETYDASLLKGLHAWDALAHQYVPSEILEPWRGYFAYYKGARDTVIDLLSQAPAAAAPVAASKAATSRGAPGAQGFDYRLRFAGGPSLRLGAGPKSSDVIGVEDEPEPMSPTDNGPRLYSDRERLRLQTDLLHWAPGSVYRWKIVAGLPARADSSPAAGRLEGSALPEGWSAWAVSKKRGLRFSLGRGTDREEPVPPVPFQSYGVPFQPGFIDTMDVLVGPASELEARLAAIPLNVDTFDAKAIAGAGRFALALKLPRAARLRLTLMTLDGRTVDRETMSLPEGFYRMERNSGGRGYPAGMYVLNLEWSGASGSGAAIPRRTALKIAIP
jgi:hypothetical protein